MTSPAMLRSLFEYNQAMNEQLWQIIMEHLTDAQFVQAHSYSRGSIRDQVVHMAYAEHYWLRWLLKRNDLAELDANDYPTREAARVICQQADQTVVDTVRGLSDADLEAIPDGWSLPLWVGLMQNALHGVEHRSQILRALHDLGLPTFDQTFADYMENAVHMTASDLIAGLDQKYGELSDLLKNVSADQMSQPVLNNWTVRDVVAILAWGEARVIEIIRSRAYTGISFSAQEQAEKDRILQAGRALPFETQLAQFQAGHREMVDAIRTLTDDDLNSQSISEAPEEMRAWKVIAIPTWWRYGVFIDPIRQLLKLNV